MWILLKGSTRFHKEIQHWVNQGLISEAQAEQLAEKYALDGSPPWYRNSSFILSAIALIVVGMGLFLLISENWQELGIYTQSAIGLLPLLAAQGVGIWAAWRERRRLAELALFFACLAFGVNIALQAQIFHISSYYPAGLLWWVVGSLPAMLYFRSSLMNVLLQLIYMSWLGLQNDFHQFSYLSLALILVFGYVSYARPAWPSTLAFMGSLYMFILNIMLNLEPQASVFGVLDPAVFILFSATFLLSFWLIFTFVRDDYSSYFENSLLRTVTAWFVLLFYLYTYEDPVREVLSGVATEGLPMLIYGLLCVAGGLFFYQSYRRSQVAPLVVILLFLFIPAFWVAPDPNGQYGDGRVAFAEGYSLAMNVAFFAYCVYLIVLGLKKRIKGSFMTGIGLILLIAFSRYLSLFEDYLITAVIFILAGGGLLLLNYFWNKRYATSK